jgi:hypothetical protein
MTALKLFAAALVLPTLILAAVATVIATIIRQRRQGRHELRE